MNYIEQLMEERDTLSAAIETTVSDAADKGGLTDDDKTKIKGMQTRVATIDGELSILATEQDSLKKANEFAARFVRSGPKRETEERTGSSKIETPGSAFVGSAEFRGYDFHGRSPRFEFNEPDPYESRAPLMTTDLPNTYKAAVVSIAQPTFTTPLFGLVNNEQISSGSFEYVNYVLENNAAVVPEGTVKPESTLTETIVPGTLDTIAHWTQVTRQALEDSARIRSIIDGKLTEGVNKKVHDSIVAAISGATLPTADGAGSLLRAIRVAIGNVQVAGFAANAILLNPMDWAQLDINVMFETNDGPQRQQTFWGLTPVASPDQPEGTAVVGAFKDAATLFYRSGVGVFATDSHAETFTSNVFTILAERRTKAVVVNPTALCEATTGVAPV
jgi:HK97 family phage major capsid protein